MIAALWKGQGVALQVPVFDTSSIVDWIILGQHIPFAKLLPVHSGRKMTCGSLRHRDLTASL